MIETTDKTGIPLIAVIGPTASGKTKRAVEIAHAFNGEIISGDSRQVYRGMDIGTGKDIEEYDDVPYHMIDICPAGSKYNLYQYLRDATDALSVIRNNGHVPIICGGTGLYIESFLNGLALPEVPENPELRESLAGKTLEELAAILSGMKNLHNVTDIDTAKRAIRAIEIQTYYLQNPDIVKNTIPSPRDAVIIGIEIGRERRRQRITDRLKLRLEQGMIDEVRHLLDKGIAPDDLIYYGLEYKFITLHILGQLNEQEMFSQLEIAIHQFAKRQMTWFRGMSKRGFHINWVPYDLSPEEFIDRIRFMISDRRP